MNQRAPVDTELMAAALYETWGNISAAADLIGCSRRYIHERINNDEDLAELVDEMRTKEIDLAKTVLHDHIAAGDKTCTIFLLKTRGGYVEKREVSGPDGRPISVDSQSTVEVGPGLRRLGELLAGIDAPGEAPGGEGCDE